MKHITAFAIVLAIVLGILAFSAMAQTVIPINGSYCNVAQTDCTLQTDGGDIGFAISGDAVILVVDGIDADGLPTETGYNGTIVYGDLTATLYRRSTPFVVTFTDGSTLTGERIGVRGGSGRGGWAWHTHWQFDTLTLAATE